MNARSKIKTSVKPARSFKKDLASHGDHSTFIVNMAHHIPDAMIALNNRFTIIGWNAAAEHTFGWRAEEAVGKNFNRLLKTKPTVNGKSNPLTIARRMGKWSGEVTRVRKDGVRIWVWSSVSVVRNEEGNPIGFICISRDVTERKRMDEKLRESQAKLASVVNSAMDAMISLDEDQRIILFNPAAELMFGCPAAEAMGQPLDRFIPERFREAHRRHIHAFGQTNQTRRAMGKLGQLTCMRTDGVEFPAEISISQAEVGGRKIYTAILRDITERLEVNKSLRTSETRFRALFEDVPIAIWEEDFSEVKEYLDSLKEQGVTDLRGYFASHPEEVIRCEQMIRVIDVNNTAVKMFEANSREELLNLTRQTNSKGELENAPEDLVAIGEGRTSRSWEGYDETLTGRPIQINLSWSVFPGHEKDYSRVIVTTLDITERKHAEKALLESEQRYRVLFEDVPIAVWEEDFSEIKVNIDKLKEEGITDFHTYFKSHPQEVLRFGQMTRILDLNKAALEMYDAENKEDLIRFIVQSLGSEESSTSYGYLVAISEGKTASSWEGRDKTMAGRIIDVNMAWTVFTGHEQDYSRIIFTTMDVTKRKQAEMARGRLSNVLEASLNEIYIFDPDSLRFEYANSGALLNLGYSLEDLKKITPVDLKPEFTEASFRELIAPLLRGEEPILNFETAHRRADGSLYPADVHLQLVETGNERAFLAVINDITHRKQAEDALQESEQRFYSAFEYASIGMALVSPEGRWLRVNRAMCDIVGYPANELLVKTFQDITHPDDLETDLDYVRRTLAGEIQTYQMEKRYFHKMGHTVWALLSVSLVRGLDGEPLYFISQIQDITERKQAELEIRRRTQDLTLITTLNEAANRGESVETITNLFTQQAFSMFDCEDIAIYLITPDGEYLDMQNETLSSETRQKIEDFIGVSIPKIRLPIREGSYTQYVLSHTEGIVTDDPSEIQRWMLEFTETTFLPNVLRAPIRAIVPRIFHLLGIRSTMTIPLVTSGQTIGLMDFSSAKRFTGEDLQRMLPISRQMTAILLRKQAESKVEVQLRRITALNDIDRTIGSSFDMRLSLEVLLKEVVSQLEVDAADVLLINPVGMSLEYVAGKGFRTTNIRRSRLKLGQGLAGKVGLQQKILHIPNLRAMEDEFIRSPLLKGEGFVEYFGVPLLAKGALKGVLEIFNRTPLHPDPDWMNYLETLGGQAAIAVDNAELFESMQRSNQELAMAYDATIAGWSRAMDLRDKETEGHTQRVTELTTQLAERMGVDARELVHIRRGALLHDIGKLGVPDSILLKPAKLTDEEWEVMRQHPRYAYEMLLPINYLHPALDIPFAHHEKWDGSGYPRKLKAEQIPLAARLFAVVDVWDALRSDRPYREKWSVERTREYILEQSGKYFDPRVVNEFMRMLDEMPELNP